MHGPVTIDLDASVIVQSLCAIVVAFYTVRLFSVTRKQQQIAAAQQRLMEDQHRLAVEMGRGALTLIKCYAHADTLCIQLKNTGRAHLTYGVIQWHDWRLKPEPGMKPWSNAAYKAFTTTLEPNELGEMVAIELPDTCFQQKGLALDEYCMAFRITYSTLGSSRVLRSAWALRLSIPQSRAYSATRWVGRDYAYDISLLEEQRLPVQ